MSIIEETEIRFDPPPSRPMSARNVYFEMQRQCHPNWCWAATASSIRRFYVAGSDWRQCDVANAVLHRTDCCDFACDHPNVAFNMTNTLASPLNRVRCLAAQTFSPPTFDVLNSELGAGHPVGARFAWQGGGAHFVVIVGTSSDERIAIKDSFYEPDGISSIAYSQFKHSYKYQQGSWTHGYKTAEPGST